MTELRDELTAQEAAGYLGYHINHVYRLLRQGRLKGRQFNRVWIIPRGEAEKLKERQDENGRYWGD